MATQIVISRIQQRRGRRENLPQPLKPGEIALTSDTRQVWIGADPAHLLEEGARGIYVYSDQDILTAQEIIDNRIIEFRFDTNFGQAQFTALLNALVSSGSVLLETYDIIWDPTPRTNPPNNFEGTSVYVAADQDLVGGSGNTLLNIQAIILGSLAGPSWISSNYVGSLVLYGGLFDEDGFLILDTQNQVTALARLINRVYSISPFFVGGTRTGIVHSNLNIEIGTGGGGGGGFSGPLPYEIGFYFGGATTVPNNFYGAYIVVNPFQILDGLTSQAYAYVVSSSEQVFDLQKNGVSFGSITFSIGDSEGVVAIPSLVNFVAGDRLEIYGPAVPDGIISNIALTLSGLLVLA